MAAPYPSVPEDRLHEAIESFVDRGVSSLHRFVHEKERDLLVKVRTGDEAGARALLNQLMGYVFFSEGGSVETVRLHGMELAALLSRVAMDGGVRSEHIHDLNIRFVCLTDPGKTMEELCYLLKEMAESFMEKAFSETGTANRYVKAAIAYVSEHYHERLTMSQTAQAAGLSGGHFSRLFKKCMGITFREHLCRVRVEESKRLLRTTNDTLGQIAVAVGFPDQSYYCKVFKRITGVSPGQFR